ncbi:MAG: response regulator transcription factor [Methylomonas sp.]|jgi:DNA-binding NarL/FixJ family response regulator|uniref:response regulator transcription factor n=1 Tax=Methylomonas sp. TaxID=418 RepID=UPI0025E41C4A|nr:response regulator transcription factor [Methylomonas sp.]MCK9607761.1 response regulator transcription factor [Methylomonas sp.]
MNRKITAILVDDHAVVRAGFRMLLSAGEKIEVVGEASRGEQAIQLYQECSPDVVVMDLSMPGIGGLETIRRILHRNSDALILVFSVHHEQVYVSRALNAGAKGYITKNSAPEILPEAIDAILRGECYVEHGLLKNPREAAIGIDQQAVLAEFSPREFDVFRLLAEGLTAQKVADQLCLGHKTVANYATQIKKKLQVDTTAELAHIAVNLGLTQR